MTDREMKRIRDWIETLKIDVEQLEAELRQNETPDELTPKQIAEELAKAQKWNLVGLNRDTFHIGNDQHISTKNYHPTENLMQALDAAGALGVWTVLYIDNRDYRVAIGSRGERENSPPKLTSQQAAHWICMRLLELEYMEES